MQNARTRFFEKYQFPGVIGYIICTHVGIIIAPSVNNPLFPEHVYVNRTNYHSINLQLIWMHTHVCIPFITHVNAQFPGSSHDAYICSLYRREPRNPFFLIGDSGYPTRPWPLTPLRDPAPGIEEIFNERFCSTRALIERCNGS